MRTATTIHTENTASPATGRGTDWSGLKNRYLTLEYGESLIVWSANGRHVQILNPAAKWLWQGLARGESPESLAAPVARACGHDAGKVITDFRTLAESWMAEPQHADSAGYPAPEQPVAVGRDPSTGTALYFHVRIADKPIRLAYTDRKQGERHRTLLSALAGDGECIGHEILIDRQPGQCRIYVDDELQESIDTGQAVLPGLIYQLARLVSEPERYRLYLHAATVRRHDHTILLCGRGGSGKSTLTAAFAHNGWGYLGDDVCLVEHDSNRVRPIPFPLCCKHGSIDLLSHGFPDLRHDTAHVSADRIAWYLPIMPPPEHSAGRAYTPAAIFFSSYDAAGRSGIEAVDTLQALAIIAESDSVLPRPITPERLEATLEWLSSIPRYRLRYSSTDEAMRLIDARLSIDPRRCPQ